MTTARTPNAAKQTRNHRLAARLGGAGAVAGVAAGLVQLTIGSRIPEWTGAKSAPAALGLLTMALSLLAGYAALSQRDDTLTTGRRTAYAVLILVPGLVCSTTVGWLWWWLPAPLLFAAGALTIDNGRASLRAIRDSWPRCLLTALGGCELLMAASAGPLLMALGGLGGAVLGAVAWTRMRRGTALGLVVVATAPFAILGWTAIAPILVMLIGAGVVLLLDRGSGDQRGAAPVVTVPETVRS